MADFKEYSKDLKKIYKNVPAYFRKKNPSLRDVFYYYFKTGILKKVFLLFLRHPIIFLTRFFSKKKLSKEEILDGIVKNLKNSFIALSYCQKPNNCPYLKFSDKCFYDRQECKNCFVGKVKSLADSMNLSFYFSLTNQQVFDEVLKPYFLKKGRIYFILNVCPMVAKATSIMAYLMNFSGIIYSFEKGFCINILNYDLAEHGIKKRQSLNSKEQEAEILSLLSQLRERITKK